MPDTPPPPLRIGVVGVGARGRLALHAEREGAVITAVCEPHPDAEKRVAAQLGRASVRITSTESLRDGSTPREVPALPDKIVEYFESNQRHPANPAAEDGIGLK